METEDLLQIWGYVSHVKEAKKYFIELCSELINTCKVKENLNVRQSM